MRNNYLTENEKARLRAFIVGAKVADAHCLLRSDMSSLDKLIDTRTWAGGVTFDEFMQDKEAALAALAAHIHHRGVSRG